MKFKVGDRVRVIKKGGGFNKEGTIWDIGETYSPDEFPTGIAYRIDLDGIGRTHEDHRGEYYIAYEAHELEPIIPLGSWDEIEQMVGFDIRARVPA